MIPRIIHQTWKTSSLPEKFRAYQKTWIRHHPGWEYRFYDDSACRAVVQESFPGLLALYDGCPYPVQRADLFRYLVVAAEGGIYADIDVECYKSMEPLLEGRVCVFGVETRLSPGETRRLNHLHAERIANCIFAADSGHPIFDRVMEEVALRLDGRYPRPEIIETTGPGMLTDVVQKYRREYDLHILPQVCWLPPTGPYYPNIFPFSLHMYAKHHFSGTWKSKTDWKDKTPEGKPRAGFPAWIGEFLERISDLYYKLPPSPLWREDFRFRKKNRSSDQR